METVETPQPTQPVETNSTDWTKMILAVLVGLGLLAGSAYAGYYYGTQEISKLKDQISNLQLKTQIPETSTPEPTVPVVADETEGWKTYTNNQAGISFKYPDGWIVEPYEIPGRDDLHAVVLVKHQTKEYGPEPGAASIQYWDNPNNLTLEEFENVHTGPAGGIRIFDPEAKIVTFASVSSYYTEQADCAPVICNKYITPQKNKIYDVSVFTRTLGNDRVVLEQILSTFKFLD